MLSTYPLGHKHYDSFKYLGNSHDKHFSIFSHVSHPDGQWKHLSSLLSES